MLRGNTAKTFNVVLRDRYGNTDLEKRTEFKNTTVFGGHFEAIESQEKDRLKIANGVKINELTDGKLKRAGLKKGFIITHIDKQPVDSPEEVNRILRSKEGGVLLEGVHANGAPDYYGLGL